MQSTQCFLNDIVEEIDRDGPITPYVDLKLYLDDIESGENSIKYVLSVTVSNAYINDIRIDNVQLFEELILSLDADIYNVERTQKLLVQKGAALRKRLLGLHPFLRGGVEK